MSSSRSKYDYSHDVVPIVGSSLHFFKVYSHQILRIQIFLWKQLDVPIKYINYFYHSAFFQLDSLNENILSLSTLSIFNLQKIQIVNDK